LLKSVDLQTIFPRSLDIQKVEEVRNNRPNVDQQAFTKELSHQSQLNQVQVQSSNSSEKENKIHDPDERGKKRQAKYRRDAGPKRKEERPEEPVEDTNRGQLIDFKF